MDDASRDFLESLPELEPGATFCFDCHPQVPCFNQCCAELTLPLTPYDVLRLCRNLGAMPGDAFLAEYTVMRSWPDTGFPLPMLRMLQGPGEPCPFVTPAGCAVYEDRPAACRYYPLGRGTKMGEKGVVERFFVVREDHCRGFDSGTTRTAQQWLCNEGLEAYNAANDRYMRLMALVRATGQPLDKRLSGMSTLCLFQLDKFRELIVRMRLFERVDADAERQKRILEDSLAGDEAALDFALDWLELVIFGHCPHLKRVS